MPRVWILLLRLDCYWGVWPNHQYCDLADDERAGKRASERVVSALGLGRAPLDSDVRVTEATRDGRPSFGAHARVEQDFNPLTTADNHRLSCRHTRPLGPISLYLSQPLPQNTPSKPAQPAACAACILCSRLFSAHQIRQAAKVVKAWITWCDKKLF